MTYYRDDDGFSLFGIRPRLPIFNEIIPNDPLSPHLLGVGLKVVRGPDWSWENQDDGEGHVGTVTEIGPSDRKPSKQVSVVWDSGFEGKYRIGYNNCYDLRILDNGLIGVSHPNVICNSCHKSEITGIRWKCKKCDNYDLCTWCYMSDKHDPTHLFTRIQLHKGRKVDVPKREGSKKVLMRGIFPSAKVQEKRRNRQDGDEFRTVEETENATRVKECCERKSFIPFSQNLETLYTSGQLCDFTIKVKNRKFPIHKAILAAHSPVFMSMFLHDMKEKASGVADIPDCEPNVFEDFLFYLYSGNIEKISSNNVTDLYEIADKYDVPCLKTDCSQVMKEAMSVDFVCDVLALGLKYGDEELINCATQFFLLNAQEIFVTTKWQNFLIQHPISANELYIKAFGYRNGKK